MYEDTLLTYIDIGHENRLNTNTVAIIGNWFIYIFMRLARLWLMAKNIRNQSSGGIGIILKTAIDILIVQNRYRKYNI
jgi:hypothetical protein